jgi:hypothetical protein
LILGSRDVRRGGKGIAKDIERREGGFRRNDDKSKQQDSDYELAQSFHLASIN